MTTTGPDGDNHSPHRIIWGHEDLTVVIAVDPDRPPAIETINTHNFALAHDVTTNQSELPHVSLVEIHTAEEGRARSSQGYTRSAVGERLRHTHHSRSDDGSWELLHIHARDDATGVETETQFRSRRGVSAFQMTTTVRMAAGRGPITLTAVTSMACSGLPHHGSSGPDTSDPLDNIELISGRSDWLAEGRWQQQPTRSVLPRLDLPFHGQDGRGSYGVTSHGTWSTGEVLPTAVLNNRATGVALAWQIENNGPWHWELGEHRRGASLTALGPTDREHQWHHPLLPDNPFTCVPASAAVTDTGGWETAIAALTDHRRALRHYHDPASATAALPIVYNDFMNTLMADPTSERVLSLARAAASVGAEVYCIDAGWYDDGDDWWDSVGEWAPSARRFPEGLPSVIDQIKTLGLIVGLWLEPEVIGVHSPLAATLPPEAFLQRNGVRVREHDRFHLDFTHPAAVSHVDAVVDRVVGEWGVGYLKLDYNINPGAGTDAGRGLSAAAGLLAHQRAYLGWIDNITARHPGLIIENCASGAMRMDYATLLRHPLQSSSDQQNGVLYPPIAASAPMSITPEQIGNWTYPQPDTTDLLNAFTLVTGLAGRPYLSGFLDRMTGPQQTLVRTALDVHRTLRQNLPRAHAFWPLALPRWDDPWVVLGLRVPGGSCYLAVWHRPKPDTDPTLVLPIAATSLQTLFPPAHATHLSASVIDQGIELRGGTDPSAAFFKWDPPSSHAH